METLNPRTLIIALLLAASTLQARVVTLTVQNYNGTTNETVEVFIESYEVAEVLSYRDNADSQRTRIMVLKDGGGSCFRQWEAGRFTP